MVATALISKLTSKLTSVVVDVPCCAPFFKHGNNNSSSTNESSTNDEKVKPVKNLHTKKPDKFSGKPSKYQDFQWVQLPVAVKKAATALGYDKEKWESKHWIDAYDKHWEDLTTEENAHCTTLGWDYDSWDHKYEHTNWADLPAIVKESATELGFTQHGWDHDEWPESLDYHWDELTDQQRLFLNVLGYTKPTWDH